MVHRHNIAAATGSTKVHIEDGDTKLIAQRCLSPPPRERANRATSCAVWQSRVFKFSVRTPREAHGTEVRFPFPVPVSVSGFRFRFRFPFPVSDAPFQS
jgi:hypothetical protein